MTLPAVTPPHNGPVVNITLNLWICKVYKEFEAIFNLKSMKITYIGLHLGLAGALAKVFFKACTSPINIVYNR